MKAILDYVAPRLTAIGVILILVYIGYNELFRRNPVNTELKAALVETRLVQADLHKLETSLQQQQTDLNTVTNQVNRVDAGLLDLSDSVSLINGRYQAIKLKMDQQSAFYLDRYNQQKQHIQDIQKLLR